MFKIENLLDIFPNQNIKELLLRSYFLSQEQNKELSDRIFDQFLLLVMQNQSINIVFDVSKENSYFDQGKNVIYLNDLSSEVLFHELTHLLSFNFLKFQVPNEYYIFINNFFTNSNNTSLITKFLDLCKKRKKEIIQSFSTEIGKEYITNANNERDKINKDSLNMELHLISLIEDIVDSIYNGESATRGLTYINNDDTNSFKVKKLMAMDASIILQIIISLKKYLQIIKQ